MKVVRFTLPVFLIILSSVLLSSCGPKKNTAQFSNDEQLAENVTPFGDPLANEKINITQTYKLSQEFKVTFKTYNPGGTGVAQFKAKSIKNVTEIAGRQPEEGKKLYLVEIAVIGNKKNQGVPDSFNQIGTNPSPQFVMINKSANRNETEATYYSDVYTADKKLFELSKITLDHEQWINTALVFQINSDWQPDLAFRFTNPDGKTEFYDIQD